MKKRKKKRKKSDVRYITNKDMFREFNQQLPLPFLSAFLHEASQPYRVGVGVGFEKPRIFDSCSSSWNRCSPNLPCCL